MSRDSAASPVGDGEGDGSDDSSTRDALAERRGLEREVYQPAEDSGLLARAAVDSLEAGERVLEVGTGSGWVAETVARETGARVVASDVAGAACRQARERANAARERGEAGYDVVRGDLTSPFADGSLDAVLFNPPYLPTDPDAAWDDWMEAALDGGPDGRAVVDPFLDTVERVLAPGGFALLLVSTLTGLDALRERAAANGLAASVVAEESHPFERLVVFRLDRRSES